MSATSQTLIGQGYVNPLLKSTLTDLTNFVNIMVKNIPEQDQTRANTIYNEILNRIQRAASFVAPGLIARFHDKVMSYVPPNMFYTFLQVGSGYNFAVGLNTRLDQIPKPETEIDIKINQLITPLAELVNVQNLDSTYVATTKLMLASLTRLDQLLPLIFKQFDQWTITFKQLNNEFTAILDKYNDTLVELTTAKAQIRNLTAQIARAQRI